MTSKDMNSKCTLYIYYLTLGTISLLMITILIIITQLIQEII